VVSFRVAVDVVALRASKSRKGNRAGGARSVRRLGFAGQVTADGIDAVAHVAEPAPSEAAGPKARSVVADLEVEPIRCLPEFDQDPRRAGQHRRVDTARDGLQFVERRFGLESELPHRIDAGSGIRSRTFLGQPQPDTQGDQPLLRAVVKVTLDSCPFEIGGLGDPAP
jgi:hypothetical protein